MRWLPRAQCAHRIPACKPEPRTCLLPRPQRLNSLPTCNCETHQSPHPVPYNSYGKSYGEHREFLEFNVDQHKELKEHAEEIGIGYATSVWDVTSAKEIASLEPDFIKVPSACNTHFPMMKVLRDEHKGPIHASTGMTTKEEIDAAIHM